MYRLGAYVFSCVPVVFVSRSVVFCAKLFCGVGRGRTACGGISARAVRRNLRTVVDRCCARGEDFPGPRLGKHGNVPGRHGGLKNMLAEHPLSL